ncbi:unnamed protein product [Vicia faba]|uniref:Uncharacterized protein n=1 Tax=Vicia faba TaxID=3906 RepID=A0AAV0YXF7_VICFA|nr:unnamed protein product [Vicia faba]
MVESDASVHITVENVTIELLTKKRYLLLLSLNQNAPRTPSPLISHRRADTVPLSVIIFVRHRTSISLFSDPSSILTSDALLQALHSPSRTRSFRNRRLLYVFLHLRDVGRSNRVFRGFSSLD